MPSVGKAWEVTFVNGAGEYSECLGFFSYPFDTQPLGNDCYLTVKPRQVFKLGQRARAFPFLLSALFKIEIFIWKESPNPTPF